MSGKPSGRISLCETVTTGKCLIGLICGSISSVTQKRTTALTTLQATPKIALNHSDTTDSPLRNRNHSSTEYSTRSSASITWRKTSTIQIEQANDHRGPHAMPQPTERFPC